MVKYVIKYVLLLTASVLCHGLVAQTVFFNHITQDEGLRNGNVRAVVKDHQGFIWVGTEDGLHRYDGYSMKVYRNLSQDSVSLTSNFILCLFEDSQHNLWVGTLDGGLCFYDRKSDVFRSHDLIRRPNSESAVAIRSIVEGRDKYLYVGSDKLMRAKIAEPIKMKFEPVALPSDSIPSAGIRVTAIEEDTDSNLLISINTQGLFKYDIHTGRCAPYAMKGQQDDIQTLYVDKHRKLVWVGSWKNGVSIYDPATNKSTQLLASDGPNSIRNNFVAAIKGDSVGNIWIGTDNGLSVVPYHANPFDNPKITTYLPDQNDQTGISGNIIKTVYVDDQDKVWVGMNYEGLSVYDKNTMNFGSLPIPMPKNSSSVYGNVNAVQQDARGNLWIGLDGGGLYFLNGRPGKPNSSPPNHVAGCELPDKIKAMKIDGDQNLWIGTWGAGVWVLNTTTQQCSKLETKSSGVNMGTDILSINTDHDGNLWIGTFDRGLFRRSQANGKIEKIESVHPNAHKIDRVNAILVDANNNVWIGKEVGGLNQLISDGKTYGAISTEHLNPSATISSLYEDHEGKIWVGVPGKGLVEYDPKSKRSRVFGEELGLVNSAIYAIQEDSLHRLWISTNAGLSVFDRQTQRFTNFNKANGLSSGQFNRNSVAKLNDGILLFGNIRGLSYFNPNDLRIPRNNKRVVLTRFFLNNIEQSVCPKCVLTENITTIKTIRLENNQNYFTVEFAALDPDFSRRVTYEYQLEGFEQNWKHLEHQRQVTYTNLPPGKYKLKVKASDLTNQQSSDIRELEIIIVPGWWQTLWFRLVLAFTVLMAALAIHLLRTRYLVAQRKKLQTLVEVRTHKLNIANTALQAHIEEIDLINKVLSSQKKEIHDKNNEILTQNEELVAQNEQIVEQRGSLIDAQHKLKEINTQLEQTVEERTKTLQVTIADLNKTVFELDRFVYSASHDLSAPLKSIRGLVEIINLEKDASNLPQYVEYIKSTVLKLESVIRNMTDYSRNTHVLVSKDKFNIHTLVEEILSELAFIPETSRIKFDNQIPKKLIIVNDRPRIKVILHNLIGNAIKYVDKSKDASWVKIECEPVNKDWKLRITDNGIGIRKEHIDRIFNMYFRATELSKGSGLGLFIVKETLDKIGGAIHVKSEYGQYTTFEMTIPDIREDGEK